VLVPYLLIELQTTNRVLLKKILFRFLQAIVLAREIGRGFLVQKLRFPISGIIKEGVAL